MKYFSIFILLILFLGCSEKSVSDNKTIDSISIKSIDTNSVDNHRDIKITQNLKSDGHYIAIGYYNDKNQLEKVDRFFNGELISE